MTDSASQFKPLYLFADSQLLFWRRNGRLLLETLVSGTGDSAPSAAYIGASNGDRPEFYEIFTAAMEAAGIGSQRMIAASFDSEDRAFLERAQIIVLAGGDVGLGWNTFKETGMKDVILARYAQGAVLAGVSAGAVQLGRHAIIQTQDSSATELVDVFNLVSAVIDVHDEGSDWARLSGTVHLLEGAAVGLGIPSGGGIIVHPDTTIEALRRPAHEYRFDGTRVTHSLLCPAEDESPPPAGEVTRQ